MFDRISRGFGLVRASWQVLMSDKELLLLPVMSLVAILAVAGAILVGAAAAGGFDDGGNQVLGIAAAFAAYFAASFLGVFFNAALVAAATQRIQGGDPSVASGLRAAWGKADKILGWALVTASVGLILRAIGKKSGWIGKLLVGAIGVAWGVLTFLVVPVLLFEPQGVSGAIKRSAGLVKERWGEQVAGNLSIQLALLAVALPFVVLGGLLVALDSPVAFVGGALVIVVFLTLSSALTAVFNAVLYRFATTGETHAAFAKGDLETAFGAPAR